MKKQAKNSALILNKANEKDCPLIGKGADRYEAVKLPELNIRRIKKVIYLYVMVFVIVIAVLIVLLINNINSDSHIVVDVDTQKEMIDGFLVPDINVGVNTPSKEDTTNNSENDGGLTKETLYFFDYSKIPSGATPIVPMDLSLSSYGSTYINNSTGYDPDTEALLSSSIKQSINLENLSASKSPTVLIVHTHGTEGYSNDGDLFFYDNGGEFARSYNENETVVGIGKILCEELSAEGINAIHCTVMHDQLQYKDSYAKAEQTIREYLKRYPTIRLVIDVHRDAIITSDGDVVRPVTVADGEAAAQLMCVVGSDHGGESCPRWQENLALALKLRERLNAKYENICRPPYLRGATYNQEISPYSLLVEVGASGNSIEEATRSIKIFATVLSELLRSSF